MAEPTSTNSKSKTCGEVTSSDCISIPGQLPGFESCGPLTLTDALSMISTVVSTVVSGGGSLTSEQIAAMDLGCLYKATTTVWTCPAPLYFRADPTSLNGTGGYCEGCCPPYLSLIVPTATSVPNPDPKPITLAGIIQLIINKIPCCDPCNGLTAPTNWCCPNGQVFVYDPTTPVGNAPGYCGISEGGVIVAATSSIPTKC